MSVPVGAESGVELENPYAGQGSVVLDIGGDVGALVVVTPASMVGVEIEIRPVGAGEHPDPTQDHAPGDSHTGHGHGHGHHPHVAVVNRPSPAGGVIPSLVYTSLTEGAYELYVKGTYAVEMTVEVRGGEVTETTWPA